jgi:SAM-dependent methyltransferase
VEGRLVTDAGVHSPYDHPELYDLALDHLDFDLPFWIETGRRAAGPVLDVGCGTGRVLLRLLEAGVDADGLDNSAPMLERARSRAAERGLRPRLVEADMRDFTMPRRYARVFCTFNAFAHIDTIDDQLRALRCMREHLTPDGATVVFMSYPKPSYWSEPDGQPVLEMETTRPDNGHRLQMWDTRFKDAAEQRQRSHMEIRELDAKGRMVASHRSATTQRWVYPYELELLLRLAGYARWQVQGGFEGRPFASIDQPMIAWGWRS